MAKLSKAVGVGLVFGFVDGDEEAVVGSSYLGDGAVVGPVEGGVSGNMS